jgi:hypothetical protein
MPSSMEWEARSRIIRLKETYIIRLGTGELSISKSDNCTYKSTYKVVVVGLQKQHPFKYCTYRITQQ